VPANTFPMMIKEYLRHSPEGIKELESEDKKRKDHSENVDFI
jgi:hypothetical protein